MGNDSWWDSRPIVVGQQHFDSCSALRSHVREMLHSSRDGETLETGSSDYKLIEAVLDFHPKGSEKSKGMVGIKMQRSPWGDNKCFHMVKDDGREEDFSYLKCL